MILAFDVVFLDMDVEPVNCSEWLSLFWGIKSLFSWKKHKRLESPSCYQFWKKTMYFSKCDVNLYICMLDGNISLLSSTHWYTLMIQHKKSHSKIFLQDLATTCLLYVWCPRSLRSSMLYTLHQLYHREIGWQVHKLSTATLPYSGRYQ